MSTGVSTTRTLPVAPSLGPNFIADAAERISPAVVRIDTERVLKTRTGVGPSDPFLEPGLPEFFFGGRGPAPRERGSGSGFILSADGTVVTNAHVVDGASKVIVTLNDGRKLTGKVVGEDTLTDLAVIKVDAGISLPTVALGDSNGLRPGEWVIAVGNPLGLDHTVTAGIISALNRSSASVGVNDRRLEFIQTDAAINPGNSGGPLVDIKGQVIGINTAIRADGQGIGFAIPINKVKDITARLVKDGRIIRPYIGIKMIGLSPELLENIKESAETLKNNPKTQARAREFFIPDAEKGIWVTDVMPNSPAARAGMRQNDIIVEVDGTSVANAAEVQNLIGEHQVGEEVTLKVQRQGKTATLRVRTIELTNQVS